MLEDEWLGARLTAIDIGDRIGAEPIDSERLRQMACTRAIPEKFTRINERGGIEFSRAFRLHCRMLNSIAARREQLLRDEVNAQAAFVPGGIRNANVPDPAYFDAATLNERVMSRLRAEFPNQRDEQLFPAALRDIQTPSHGIIDMFSAPRGGAR